MTVSDEKHMRDVDDIIAACNLNLDVKHAESLKKSLPKARNRKILYAQTLKTTYKKGWKALVNLGTCDYVAKTLVPKAYLELKEDMARRMLKATPENVTLEKFYEKLTNIITNMPRNSIERRVARAALVSATNTASRKVIQEKLDLKVTRNCGTAVMSTGIPWFKAIAWSQNVGPWQGTIKMD